MKKRARNLLDAIGVGKSVARSDLVKSANDKRKLDRWLTKPTPGHNLLTQRFESELYYRLEPETVAKPLKPRIWQLARCSNAKKPYLWIQFPDMNFKKLMVVPLSDVHWGAEECRYDEIRDFVRWIGSTSNVFTFLNGDIVNNALANSVGGSVHSDIMTPTQQVKSMIELLRPIAHKILWAIPGNHEGRTIKIANLDPLEWICMMLNIPYYDQPVFSNILWRNHRFNFYCMHGTSGSRTIGGKLNAAARPMEWTEFTMFYVMGHVHEPMGNPITRRCVVRTYYKNGKLKELKIVDRDQYVIIAGAWLNFWQSYAHRSAYAPPPQGSPFAYLLANGGYEISQ